MWIVKDQNSLNIRAVPSYRSSLFIDVSYLYIITHNVVMDIEVPDKISQMLSLI